MRWTLRDEVAQAGARLARGERGTHVNREAVLETTSAGADGRDGDVRSVVGGGGASRPDFSRYGRRLSTGARGWAGNADRSVGAVTAHRAAPDDPPPAR